MNKKLLLYSMIIPLLAIVVVSATLLSHYGFFDVQVDAHQPITVNLEEGFSAGEAIQCDSGDICRGEIPLKITNDGDDERTILIEDGYIDGITTSYIGELELSKKNVNFSLDIWTLIPGDEVTIEYTVVGNNFSAEVTNNSKEGYILIYYPDNDDRFVNPSEAWQINCLPQMNLPAEWDWNNGEDPEDYDYCETGEYSTCNGAKIWYVPSNAINGEDELDWNRASEFFFETALIQYNAEGEIIIYGDSELIITPEYSLDVALASGIYNITTGINPIN